MRIGMKSIGHLLRIMEMIHLLRIHLKIHHQIQEEEVK